MTVTFSTTRDAVIGYALQELGVIGEGDTPSTAQVTESTWHLQSLIKLWAADGMPLWDLKVGYILPTTGVSSVQVGASSVNSVSSYATTTTSAAAILGASTITVTSATSISASDAIGIDLGDGTVQWTTVNGAPSGSTVTLAATLTKAVASGNRIITYTTTNRLTRPLRVISAYQYNLSADTRFRISVITKDEYFSLGAPTASGVPTQVYYDPQLGSGVLYIYPRFSGATYLIQITYHKEFDDVNSSSDTFDFPQEYYLSLMKGLASTMGGKYGLDALRRRELMAEAKDLKDLALSNGTEEGSLRIVPENA